MAAYDTGRAVFDPVPEDTLITILGLLQPADLVQAECTSRRFRKLVVSNSLWRRQCCLTCVNVPDAVAAEDTKEDLSIAGLRIAAAAVSKFPDLSCFYKRLCMEMQSAVCGVIGEDTLVVRTDSEMRMMDASIDLLQLPLTKQLILDDPQLLLLKLRHSLTLVDCVSIGASCQRALELPSQQMRFHFGLTVAQLASEHGAADDEGPMCTRTFTVHHRTDPASLNQDFVIKPPVLCIGDLVKVELLDSEDYLPSATKAGMYTITLTGRVLRSFTSEASALRSMFPGLTAVSSKPVH